MSNPTNPEQGGTCDDCMLKWIDQGGPGSWPMDCEHGKVAANVNTTNPQAKLNVNEAAKHSKPGDYPADKLQGHEASAIIYDESPAPAPVDQPDELEQQTAKLHELEAKVDATELEQRLYDQILREVRVFHCAEHGPVCATLAVSIATKISGLWAQSLAREREASYAEGWRHGKFLEKNRHILHLRYMLDGYPSDAPEYTYVKSLFEREIAALTKGETT